MRVFQHAMVTHVRPVTRERRFGSRAWRRILLGALLVVASVAAQALDLTPLAIALFAVGAISVLPLALPSVDV